MCDQGVAAFVSPADVIRWEEYLGVIYGLVPMNL